MFGLFIGAVAAVMFVGGVLTNGQDIIEGGAQLVTDGARHRLASERAIADENWDQVQRDGGGKALVSALSGGARVVKGTTGLAGSPGVAPNPVGLGFAEGMTAADLGFRAVKRLDASLQEAATTTTPTSISGPVTSVASSDEPVSDASPTVAESTVASTESTESDGVTDFDAIGGIYEWSSAESSEIGAAAFGSSLTPNTDGTVGGEVWYYDDNHDRVAVMIVGVDPAYLDGPDTWGFTSRVNIFMDGDWNEPVSSELVSGTINPSRGIARFTCSLGEMVFTKDP